MKLPVLSSFDGYSTKRVPADLIAGITVWAVLVPEALAYATIAGVSPSGLSLDGPAHLYHRALMAEITSARHERIGDALLAAQKSYAQAGLMPELLAIYQLLGDPTLKSR